MLEFNSNNKITDITIAGGTDYIMTGVSYWNAEDGNKLNNMLEKMVEKNGFENLFWDDLVKDNLKDFNIKIHKVESNDWVEIDSVTDLRIAEDIVKNQ